MRVYMNADMGVYAVFAMGQSVRPEPGRGRTEACRPIWSFSKVLDR